MAHRRFRMEKTVGNKENITNQMVALTDEQIETINAFIDYSIANNCAIGAYLIAYDYRDRIYFQLHLVTPNSISSFSEINKVSDMMEALNKKDSDACQSTESSLKFGMVSLDRLSIDDQYCDIAAVKSLIGKSFIIYDTDSQIAKRKAELSANETKIYPFSNFVEIANVEQVKRHTTANSNIEVTEYKKQ